VDLTDETFADTSELTRHRMQQQLELALQRYPGVSDVSMTRERSMIDLDEAPAEFTPADSTVTTGNTQIGVHSETQQLVAYRSEDLTDETFADTSELTRHRMQQQLELALQRYPGVSDVSMTRERSMIDLDEAPAEFTPADSTVTTGNTQIGVHSETQQLVAYEANSTSTMDGFPNVANLEPADPTMNRQRNTAAFLNADRDTLYAANDATQSYEIATG